jgi:hypothetical protein
MEICARQRHAVQCRDDGGGDLWWRSGASHRFSASLVDRLGFWSGGYSDGGEPRSLSPWPPLPLIVLRDKGPPAF